MGYRLGLALLAALGACATAEPPSGIENRDWYLVAIGKDTQVAATEAARPTLRLDADGSRAAGFAGCNRFTGSFERSEDRIAFGPMASTKMYCAETAAVEDRYLAALGQVVRWSVGGDQLTLSSEAGPVLRFRELATTRRMH